MHSPIDRRDMIRGSVALAAMAIAQRPLELLGGPAAPEGAEQIHFREVQPKGRAMVQWEDLKEWLTPDQDLFSVGHYPKPSFDPAQWKLSVEGLVRKPRTWNLSDLQKRPRRETIATLECSGNGASPGFMGAVGNIRWTGTPLAGVLKECGIESSGIEVVFFGADEGKEKIKDNEVVQNFGRSLPQSEALDDRILLAYEMNGKPLPFDHGGPVRLVVPGWYGVAWVKWLTRIDVRDHRFAGRFMARDYVTLRGEEKDGKVTWCESTVGPLNPKSIVARVFRMKDGSFRVEGAAWTNGSGIESVELKVDDGKWVSARLDKPTRNAFAWRFWSAEIPKLSPGRHALVSRAKDKQGRLQPSADDPRIKLKKTYYEANQQLVRTVEV